MAGRRALTADVGNAPRVPENLFVMGILKGAGYPALGIFGFLHLLPNTENVNILILDGFDSTNRTQHPNIQADMIDEKTYAAIMDVLPIVTVDVVPFNEAFEKILLFERRNKPVRYEYYSPGGRLLKNETFMEGAVRQCRRELGLDIEKEKLIPGGAINEIWGESSFENVTYHAVNIFFGYVLPQHEFASLRLDAQHCGYKWFDVTDPSMHPNVKERVSILLQNASS